MRSRQPVAGPVTGRSGTAEDALDFGRQLRALAARDVNLVACHVRDGVVVHTAANRDERDGAGEAFLFNGADECGPVPPDKIVRQRHRVVGMRRQHRSQLALPGQVRTATRQRVIGGTADRAAVLREAHFPDAPGQARRLPVRQRLARDLLEVMGELCSVPVDVRLVFQQGPDRPKSVSARHAAGAGIGAVCVCVPVTASRSRRMPSGWSRRATSDTRACETPVHINREEHGGAR